MERTEHDYYQSLYQIAAVVNSIGAPGAILRAIVENVARALEAKGCSLLLLSPDRKQLLPTTAYGLSDQFVRKGPLSADKSIAEALVGTPVAVFDATKDKRIQYQEETRKEGIASILSVPITLREEVIGVIRAYTAEPRHFTTDDMYFVSAVANLGAIALENAQLYESIQQDYTACRQEMLAGHAAEVYQWLGEDYIAPPPEE